MSQSLPTILKAARQLPLEERRELVEQLSKEMDKMEDPILKLGSHPISEDVSDASANHDRYIYRS